MVNGNINDINITEDLISKDDDILIKENQDSIVVNIFNEIICLGVDNSMNASYIESLANYIDDTALSIKEKSPHYTDKMVLILVALNIADMLHRKDSEYKESNNAIQLLYDKTISIIEMIDDKNKN